MRHPDVFTRCIKMDGTIDLERLKRLSRELQEDYEQLLHEKVMIEVALHEIVNKGLKVIEKLDKESAVLSQAADSQQKPNNQSTRSISHE